MTEQNKKQKPIGTLYMAANHLGNDEDTPSRSLEALRLCDLVVFEEAKVARKTLKKAGITKEFLLYNEHRQDETIELVRKSLKKGKKVCYMSDQGSPTLCDPGSELTKCAFELGSTLKVIPGPSSVSSAMSACPFKINGFIFTGLLPRKKEERQRELKRYLNLKLPLITLDAPYRREALLEAIETSDSKRKVFLALDISGPDEAYHYGSLKEVRKKTKDLGKINFILILS